MHKVLIAASLFASLALAGAGCGGGGTCEAAIDNVGKIMMKEVKGDEAEMAKKMFEGMKGELVKKCNEEKPSAAALGCAANAKTKEDLEKCDGFKGM